MWEHPETAPRDPPQPPPMTHNRVIELSEVVSEVSFNILTNLYSQGSILYRIVFPSQNFSLSHHFFSFYVCRAPLGQKIKASHAFENPNDG